MLCLGPSGLHSDSAADLISVGQSTNRSFVRVAGLRATRAWPLQSAEEPANTGPALSRKLEALEAVQFLFDLGLVGLG
jgi:hypothetical protein